MIRLTKTIKFQNDNECFMNSKVKTIQYFMFPSNDQQLNQQFDLYGKGKSHLRDDKVNE